jgi:hypothetical protein
MVFVQCEAEPAMAAEEVDWVQELALEEDQNIDGACPLFALSH